MDFEAWMERVDAIVYKRVGVSVYDLPDFSFWDSWEAGESPAQCARDAIDNGFDF